jgi:hypothetical protein
VHAEALIDAIMSDIHAAYNHLDEEAVQSSKNLVLLKEGVAAAT